MVSVTSADPSKSPLTPSLLTSAPTPSLSSLTPVMLLPTPPVRGTSSTGWLSLRANTLSKTLSSSGTKVDLVALVWVVSSPNTDPSASTKTVMLNSLSSLGMKLQMLCIWNNLAVLVSPTKVLMMREDTNPMIAKLLWTTLDLLRVSSKLTPNTSVVRPGWLVNLMVVSTSPPSLPRFSPTFLTPLTHNWLGLWLVTLSFLVIPSRPPTMTSP
mmetsp:Transcript_25040/g.38985  ORF Transcript_25040/g.38985 Transcript_25040/m.38985 type:complete len:213 (+) Transcript_25040:71-709(+)